MAGRSHADVSERRLRPIYDCLDSGNNKKAIQEADKVLKKHKDFQCAKVLKALALLRIGRHDESSASLQEVHAQNPTDEATLHAMAICYRELHKLDLIVEMYENGHKSQPDNEEILSALFMAYVRIGDSKKQQHTAMKLHKLKPNKNPYYFWGVMSIVMQAHAAKDEKMKNTMYVLAERMTAKYVKEDKIEAEAEVQMYLIILEILGKHEEALTILQGPLGEKLVSDLNFRAVKTAEMHCKLQQYSPANIIYKTLLRAYPDDWQHWKNYISTVFRLVETGSDSALDDVHSATDETPDNTLEKATKFIHKDVKASMIFRIYRGPYLAELELYKQLQANDMLSQVQLGSSLDLLLKYYELFGDRACCFADMQPYLCLLSEDETQQFIDEITEKVGLTSEEGEIVHPQSIKHMQRHIALLQCSYFLNYYEKYSVAEKLSLCQEFMSRYKKGLEFGGELLVTDTQYSDSYLLLAVYLINLVWQHTGSSSHAWQMVLCLETGLQNSSANFQFKLLLMQVYARMGSFGPCPVLYESMEIKHIMTDTLGYTAFNHVSRLGHFGAASYMYGSMLRFFTVNHKETAEYLIASYKYGSFAKIYEFVAFREKLQNSLQYALATVERVLLDLILETNNHNNTEQLVTYMEIDPEKDKTDLDELSDNRDLSIIWCYEPSERWNMEEVKENSCKEEKCWLKLRNLTLRLLAGCVLLGKQSGASANQTSNGVNSAGDKRCMTDVIHDLIEQFTQHVAECRPMYSQHRYCPIQGPFRTRLITYLSDIHSTVLLDMLQIVLYVNRLLDEGFDKVNEESEEKLKSGVVDVMQAMVSTHKYSLISDDTSPSLNPEVIEHYVQLTETLSHLTMLAGVCHKLLKPYKTNIIKKCKKKKQPVPELPVTFANFTCLVSGLESAGKDLRKSVMDIDPVFLSLDLSSLKLTESLVETETAEQEVSMWRKVEKSYQQSSKEISDLIHNKLHYLNSLKL